MNTIQINKHSLSYWLATTWGAFDECDRSPTLCQYISAVAWGSLRAMLTLIVPLFVLYCAGDWLGWVVASIEVGQPVGLVHTPDVPVEFPINGAMAFNFMLVLAIGLAGAVLALMAVLFVACEVQSFVIGLRDASTSDKPLTFTQQLHLRFVQKTCVKINFKA